MFSICCITISFWEVTKVVVKPSFELKRVRWRRKFVRLMHFFEINVAECNLKPSMKCFKTFGIQKIASNTHNFLYFSMKIAIYNRCELRMTRERKSARSISYFTACILPSSRKSCVNKARFKVFLNYKFASLSGW